MAEANSFNILPLMLSKEAEEVEGISCMAEAKPNEEIFLNEKPTMPETFNNVMVVKLPETAAKAD